jgi:hypothetical protein
MKTALLIAASFVLTSTACFAADCKTSCDSKKVSLFSKLLHKKMIAEKKSEASGLQIAGSNLIIN